MLLVVPGPDVEPWPTIGDQVCDFIEDRGIYGPGSLQGEPYVIDPEFRAWIYRAFEVYPQHERKVSNKGQVVVKGPHPWAGRRRFKRCGLSVRKGLAKCLAPDTSVLLASGREVRADQVAVGDVVLAYRNGRLVPSRVSHVEMQPRSPMWRVVTERGREIVVTNDHPVLVRGTRMLPGVPKRRRYASCDPDRDREQWVPAADLIVGDRIVVGLGWKSDGGLDIDDAWLLGAFVGDGSPDGRFTSEDPEIVGRIAERFPMTHCDRYDYYARGVRPFLREHDLAGCNSRTKRVPDAVQTANQKAVAAFLAGYFDTDGWASFSPRPRGKTHSEIAWGSVNRPLLVQCQTLLAGLGINATICESHGTYQGRSHLSWNLAVRDTVQAAHLASLLLEHSTHPRKRGKLVQLASRMPGKVFARRDTDKVTRIESAGESVSVAIEVEGIHTHVTGGLVTHNTEKEALIVFAHIHPEGPAKCDGFDAQGHPVAAPVKSPYVPMLAYTQDQVEELAYGALKYIVEHGPDADLFDVSLERIIRLDDWGREDGKAVPLAQSPDSRDGARTTLNAFDEPHRLYMPRHLQAHETMAANLPKRPLEDPWSLYVGTAGELGQGSVAEGLHAEAEQIRDGLIERPDLFYLYRTDDDPQRDLSTKAERIEAIREATGPAGEWGPGQFDDIASQWDRPSADHAYLERVWLNRWVKSGAQAFDVKRWDELSHERGDVDAALRGLIPKRAEVVVGFDGARRRDSTGFVITDLATGTQELFAGWECDLDDPDWEIDPADVDQSRAELFARYRVRKFYGDPPYWVTEMGEWAAEHPGLVEEWWTNRYKIMGYAVRAYKEAMTTGAVGWSLEHPNAVDLARHIGNAGQKKTNFVVEDGPDEGQPLYNLQKIHPDRKFDFAMAGCLSWQAYLDVTKKTPKRRPQRPRRLR